MLRHRLNGGMHPGGAGGACAPSDRSAHTARAETVWRLIGDLAL